MTYNKFGLEPHLKCPNNLKSNSKYSDLGDDVKSTNGLPFWPSVGALLRTFDSLDRIAGNSHQDDGK